MYSRVVWWLRKFTKKVLFLVATFQNFFGTFKMMCPSFFVFVKPFVRYAWKSEVESCWFKWESCWFTWPVDYDLFWKLSHCFTYNKLLYSGNVILKFHCINWEINICNICFKSIVSSYFKLCNCLSNFSNKSGLITIIYRALTSEM